MVCNCKWGRVNGGWGKVFVVFFVEILSTISFFYIEIRNLNLSEIIENRK